MTTADPTSYDEVPYPSLPSRRTHPCHLAAIARLRGLDPPPPERARVLELGCAAGGNLLPLAADFPDSTFIGVDASARQIADGERAIAATGLPNVRLLQLDLRDAGGDLGQFDYVVCHGVYSWVPRPVQDRILALARQLLTPMGIFFVSYNTYPGWHMRGVVREMMAYHVRGLDGATARIGQARALLDFLVRAAIPPSDAYRQLLRDEAAILKDRDDAYLYHEHLEDVNEPLYFHQFMDRAEVAGLGYIGDTDVSTLAGPAALGPEAAELLRQASPVQREQYADFLQNRMFRGSLLCHREVAPPPRVDSLRLAGCGVGLEDRVEIPAAAPAGGPLVCQTPTDTITVPAPLTQAAVRLLNDVWPGCLPFDELLERARQQTGGGDGGGELARQRRALADDLLVLYSRRLLRAWVDPPACVPIAGDRPRATPLARWQASQGLPAATRRHEGVRLSDLERCLLPRLDGAHDRVALRQVLADAVARGEFEIRRNEAPIAQPDDATLDRIVEHTLASLAGHALLIG